MSETEALNEDNKESFGACTYSSRAPADLMAGTKAVNLVMSFEEALKLNVALAAAVQALTRKNRSTPDKRRAGVKLIVHLEDKNRIRVQLGKIPKPNP